MGKHITDFEKGLVFAMKMCGKSYREIELYTGINKTTSARIVADREYKIEPDRKTGTGLANKLRIGIP